MPLNPSRFSTQAPVAIGRPEVLIERARQAEAAGRREEAIGLYRRIHQMDPMNIDAANDLGRLFLSARMPEVALGWYDQSLRLDPSQASVWIDRAMVLSDLGRFQEALDTSVQLIRLQPTNAAGYILQAVTLHRLGRFPEALTAFTELLPHLPDDAATHCNRGSAAQWCGRYDEAFRDFDRAIALAPEHGRAHVNKAVLMMLMGDFAGGTRLTEQHWRKLAMAQRPTVDGPLWDGQADLKGKTLYLYWEQGFGDTLFYSRYVAAAAAAGARVILEVQKPLATLMASLPGVHQVIEEGQASPGHDLRYPLVGLPGVFETPPPSIPYLFADPARAVFWRERLSGLTGPRIGLVWAGGSGVGSADSIALDQRRSIPLASLAPLAVDNRCSFVSIQKGEPGRQTAPGGMNLHDFTAELNDFADTAAMIENLDLVIGVDTSTIHLVGALGKPVWMLNRFDTDARWLLEREDSHWYPTMRIFRQRASGDWVSVIARVAEELRKFAAA